MEATKLLSPNLHHRPVSLASPCRKRNIIVAFDRGMNGRDYGGNLVDDNMIELRVRLREMKMLEACNNPPSHWMEWEKQYCGHYKYNADICQAIGLLQNYLINIRPSLALGMVALLVLSVPISTGVVLFHIVEIVKRILSGFHIG